MITGFYPKDSGCYTDGCGCCSNSLNIKIDKKEILKEAEGNIVVVKEICDYYNISFEEFCNKIKVSEVNE